MGGLQQLLWRSTKLCARSSASSGSIRLLSNTSGFRAHTTYSVSRTVLDIDAANNEHVKPFPIRRIRKGTREEDVDHVKPLQQSVHLPSRHPNSEGKPKDLFSEEHALWMNNNAAIYKDYFDQGIWSPTRAAFMRVLDITAAHLDRTGTPFSPAFTALGFRRASMFSNGKNKWYLDKVGRYFEEVKKRNWEFEVAQAHHSSDGGLHLSLVSEVDGVKDRWLVTRDFAAIRPLLCLEAGAKKMRDELQGPPIVCVRDLVTNREQYVKYLDMVGTMRGFMRGQFRNEWLQESESGYLAQPPFEAAVQFVSSFAGESPATAAEVIEKWVAGEKSSVAEFRRRVNDEFKDYLIKGSGSEQERYAAQEKAKINTMIDEVETKPQFFDQKTLAMWEEGVKDKIGATSREIYMTFLAASTTENGLKIRSYIPKSQYPPRDSIVRRVEKGLAK